MTWKKLCDSCNLQTGGVDTINVIVSKGTQQEKEYDYHFSCIMQQKDTPTLRKLVEEATK